MIVLSRIILIVELSFIVRVRGHILIVDSSSDNVIRNTISLMLSYNTDRLFLSICLFVMQAAGSYGRNHKK